MNGLSYLNKNIPQWKNNDLRYLQSIFDQIALISAITKFLLEYTNLKLYKNQKTALELVSLVY